MSGDGICFMVIVVMVAMIIFGIATIIHENRQECNDVYARYLLYKKNGDSFLAENAQKQLATGCDALMSKK
jgi:hypothetical protein